MCPPEPWGRSRTACSRPRSPPPRRRSPRGRCPCRPPPHQGTCCRSSRDPLTVARSPAVPRCSTQGPARPKTTRRSTCPSPARSRRTRSPPRERRGVRNAISLSLFLLCGRERLDHTKRLEPGELGHQRHLAARRGFESEEADLALGDVDRSPEGDARPLARHFLGGRARPMLARLALTCSAACEERFYEVIRHASDAMARRSA